MARHGLRSARSFRRPAPARAQYDVALIVCEGEKTEPEYLKGLRKALDVNPANVKIVSAEGNDPVSIVREAIQTYSENPGEFDRVFCVFDRDGHANYQQALNMVANSRLGRNGVLTAIVSVPCFEIWILLHYAYSSAPVTASGGRSACENVVAAIHRHLPEYEKAFGDLFETLAPMLEAAITHADRLAAHNRDTGSDNPATKVNDLVKYLKSLKRN
jgi:hypothetical protein